MHDTHDTDGRQEDRDGTDVASGPSEAHLQCRGCETNPTVARLDGRAHLVCHCTGPDNEIEPVRCGALAQLPNRWMFVPHGGGTDPSEADAGGAEKKLRELIDQWHEDTDEYPSHPQGRAAEAAVRLCAEGLAEVVDECYSDTRGEDS